MRSGRRVESSFQNSRVEFRTRLAKEVGLHGWPVDEIVRAQVAQRVRAGDASVRGAFFCRADSTMMPEMKPSSMKDFERARVR